MVAEGCNEFGGKWDCDAVFEQRRETVGELDEGAWAELAWELDIPTKCATEHFKGRDGAGSALDMAANL